MSLVIEGLSGTQADVDSGNNLKVNMGQDAGLAGYARIVSTDGSGIDTTENGFLRVSSANPQFIDQVDGSNVNTVLYSQSINNMTITQTGGFWNLNAGAAITANAYAIQISNKVIPLYGTLPLTVDITARILNLPQANCIGELGVGNVATNAAPTDGAFFRFTAAGTVVCVINNGGVETSSAVLSGVYVDTTAPSITMPTILATGTHLYNIEVVEDQVVFQIDDVQVAAIPIPLGQAYPFNAGRQQVFGRVYNTGTSPSLAPQIMVGQVSVVQEDMNQNKTWDETLICLGRGAYQSPVSTFTQTSNHTNSTSPSSATLSNTAAGYTTLGGRYQFASVGGAATDYALFVFQVPSGYQLIIKSIAVSCMNTGAIGASGVPTVFDWGLGLNSSAVSLATADAAATNGSPTAYGPRRIPLGMQSFGLLAAIGLTSSDIVRSFPVPLCVDSGRYLHVIVQCPVGTATSSQVFRGDIYVNGYFE